MGEELWIPIVMFISIAAVVISFFYYGHKNKVTTMKTVQKAVESGTNLTPELLEQISQTKAIQPPKIKDLRRGIILSALGVAGIVASFMFTDPDPREFFRIVSLLPLFVGAGFLLVWKLNRYDD